MSTYLASEESYVICTNAIVSESRLLICNDDRRKATTVQWGSKGKIVLVEVDTTIEEDFTCATKLKSIIDSAGFWGGFAAGLLSIAGIAAIIPGPGWVWRLFVSV